MYCCALAIMLPQVGQRHAGTEEGQRRLGQNGGGEQECTLYQQRRNQIRQQVHQHHAPVGGAQCFRRFNELQFAQDQRAAACDAAWLTSA
jgi:hypothetical protein